MGVEIEDDLDELPSEAAENAIDQLKEGLEDSVNERDLECDCGGQTFDVEVWESAQGNLQAAGVCRSCNVRVGIDVDTSGLNKYL